MPWRTLFIVNADLPVFESSGFTADIRSHTSGQVFPLCLFDHWDIVVGVPNDVITYVGAIVVKIQQRKVLH